MTDGSTLPQLRSWLSDGPNEPVTAEQITAALGEDEVARIASETGMQPAQAAAVLAEELPGVIDAASPHGRFDPSLVQPETRSLVALQGASAITTTLTGLINLN